MTANLIFLCCLIDKNFLLITKFKTYFEQAPLLVQGIVSERR